MHKAVKRRNWTKDSEIIDICRVRERGISANGKSSSCLMIITHHTNSKAALVLILEQRRRQQEGWKEIVEWSTLRGAGIVQSVQWIGDSLGHRGFGRNYAHRQNVQAGSGAHPPYVFSGTDSAFLRNKPSGREANHSYPFVDIALNRVRI